MRSPFSFRCAGCQIRPEKAMAEIVGRVSGIGKKYQAEVHRPGKVTHVARGFSSWIDAQHWLDEYQRLLLEEQQADRPASALSVTKNRR
jgi:hypothetical protein